MKNKKIKVLERSTPVKLSVKLTIPDNMAEVTLDKYIDWMNVLEINGLASGDDSVELDINMSFIEQKALEILCDAPLALINKLDRRTVSSIAKDLFLMQLDNPKKLVQTFKLNNLEFGLIPDFEDMSIGEFTDASEYTKDKKDLNKLLAVLYRPITRKYKNEILGITQYDIEPYEGSAKYSGIMRKSGANIGISLAFFLQNSLIQLQRDTVAYLEKEMQKTLVFQEYLTQNGGGLQPFTSLLTSISSN